MLFEPCIDYKYRRVKRSQVDRYKFPVKQGRGPTKPLNHSPWRSGRPQLVWIPAQHKMAQNPNRNSDDASESHTCIDMGECAFSKSSPNVLLSVSGCSGTRWPCGIGNLFPCCKRPKAASDFYDGSYDFYTMYNEKTDKIDKELVTSWSEHVRDLMVLVRYAPFLGTSMLTAHE